MFQTGSKSTRPIQLSNKSYPKHVYDVVVNLNIITVNLFSCRVGAAPVIAGVRWQLTIIKLSVRQVGPIMGTMIVTYVSNINFNILFSHSVFYALLFLLSLYWQIRCLMTRLNNAFHSKLRHSRPCKICTRCDVELRFVQPCMRKARNYRAKPEEPAIKNNE